jgi:hypothetical protein
MVSSGCTANSFREDARPRGWSLFTSERGGSKVDSVESTRRHAIGSWPRRKPRPPARPRGPRPSPRQSLPYLHFDNLHLRRVRPSQRLAGGRRSNCAAVSLSSLGLAFFLMISIPSTQKKILASSAMRRSSTALPSVPLRRACRRRVDDCRRRGLRLAERRFETRTFWFQKNCKYLARLETGRRHWTQQGCLVDCRGPPVPMSTAPSTTKFQLSSKLEHAATRL